MQSEHHERIAVPGGGGNALPLRSIRSACWLWVREPGSIGRPRSVRPSEDDPTQQTTAVFTGVTVSMKIGKMSLEVSPLMAQGRQATYKATFINGSNSPVSMVLEGQDAEEALLFRMRPDDAIEVPAGGQSTISVRVRPERRHLIGNPHSFSFELRGMPEDHADSAPADPTLTRQVRFTYVPRIRALLVPMWLWNSTRLVALLMAVGVALGFSYVGLNHIANINRTSPTNTGLAVAQLLLTVNAPGAKNGGTSASGGERGGPLDPYRRHR